MLKRELSLSFGGLLLFFLASCGSAEVELDPTGTDQSIVQLEVPGSGEDPSDNAARNFFENTSVSSEGTLLQIMVSDGPKNCIEAGCHVEDADEAQFFQLRESESDFNWNYVGSRQFQVLIGQFASAESSTLEAINQDTDGNQSLHESFAAWTTEELCALQQWTYIESGESEPDPCEFTNTP